MGGGGTYIPLQNSAATPTTGGLRISAIWRFPETLRELGVDVEAMLAEAGCDPRGAKSICFPASALAW